MSLVYWILILILWILKATSLQEGSRTVLREIANNNSGGRGSDPKDYGVGLNVTNFDRVLKDTPATYAIVEFYAHWCPACRNYKPHYEKVARLFNGPDAVHPAIILMTRVDCALKINTKICDKFSVGHYPMLFWGPSTKFCTGWKPNQAKSEIRVIDDGRTAERLLNWINKQIGSSYGLDDEKFENEHLPSNISDPGQGIPEQAEAPPMTHAPVVGQTTSPLAQPQQPALAAAVRTSGHNANPLDLFPQGLPNMGAGGAGAGTLDILRNNPQFQPLRAMVQANPQILQPMLQELGKQNPHLMRLIQEHQADFLRLINEPAEGGEGNILGQLAEAMPEAVQVTPKEREAI